MKNILLEKGEFIKEIETGEIHWIEKIEREYITIAKQLYENGYFFKDYFNLTKEDFYTKYTDVEGGN